MTEPQPPETGTTHTRDAWRARQREFGNTPRSVLLKGLPAGVNAVLHRWHEMVLRWSLHQNPVQPDAQAWILDLGCGYGRMAPAALEEIEANLVGIDFAQGFSAQFARDHGHGVCGDLARLPFAQGSLAGAHAITALMYLPEAQARAALARLDDSLRPGAQVLLLEATSEFNRVARLLTPWKRHERLAQPGFTQAQMLVDLVPDGWDVVACGSNLWTTALLPLFVLFHRWLRTTALLERIARSGDAPGPRNGRRLLRRFGMHRWVLYRKAG